MQNLTKYDFETLAMLQNTALFKGDMREFMMERNYPMEIVIAFTGSDAVKTNNLITLFNDWGTVNDEYNEYFFKYLDDNIAQWVKGAEEGMKYLLDEKKKIAVKDELSDIETQRLGELNRAIKMNREVIAKYGDA